MPLKSHLHLKTSITDAGQEGVEPDFSKFLGSQIRSLRKARGITLDEMSRKTGLSTGNLSQIERNITSPTVKVVHSISRVLGVNVSWFFADARPAPPGEEEYIVRADRRRTLEFDMATTDSLLSPNLDGNLEMLLSRYGPGADSGEEAYTHNGEEGGIVISGQLELWIGEKYFLLNEGDSFAFPSTIPHRCRNPGEVETIVIMAITPPSY